MHARVVNGRWVLDDPAGLPEGTVVEIVTRPVAAAGPATIYIDDRVRQYVHAVVIAANAATRPGVDNEIVEHAKTLATRDKRGYVTPADAKLAVIEVLGRSERVEQALALTAVP
ncbi:MAG TPA: hypothetical protein VGL61_02115 [Kofleriaceae bacterium]|jgi:histone H3/H4